MKTKISLLTDPLLVDSAAAGKLLARRALFNHMLAAGWIKPVIQRHKCKLFCLDDLRRCVRRLKQGEYPRAGKN